MKTLALFLGGSLLTLAFAAEAHEYLCNASNSHARPSHGSKLILSLEDDTVKVTNDLGVAYQGTFDDKYEPRANVSYVRYLGTYLPIDNDAEDETDVLLQEKMLRGAKTGNVKFQTHGRGFAQTQFKCVLSFKASQAN